MRAKVIEKLKDYFDIKELVGPDTYNYLKEQAWQVFDTDTLTCLLIPRVGIDLPFNVNNWHKGGIYDERGFRSNIQPIVAGKTKKNILYLSGHPLGKAFDYQVTGMDAENVRNWIELHEDEFPCKVRLEWKKTDNDKKSLTYGEKIPITWVHFDTKQIDDKPKIYKFNI